MRTTLDIDDDVLQAAKELARREGQTAGKMLSSLARRGLTGARVATKGKASQRHGVPLVPSRGEVVTLEHIRALLDQEGT